MPLAGAMWGRGKYMRFYAFMDRLENIRLSFSDVIGKNERGEVPFFPVKPRCQRLASNVSLPTSVMWLPRSSLYSTQRSAEAQVYRQGIHHDPAPLATASLAAASELALTAHCKHVPG